MRQFFHALLDLEFSLVETALRPVSAQADSGSTISAPSQTFVFARTAHPISTDERLLASFEPSTESLEVEVTVLDSGSDHANSGAHPAALNTSDRRRRDRLTIRNTDGEAVRGDLIQLLDLARA